MSYRHLTLWTSHRDSDSLSLKVRGKSHLTVLVLGIKGVVRNLSATVPFTERMLRNLSSLSLYCFDFSFPWCQHTDKTRVPVSAYSIGSCCFTGLRKVICLDKNMLQTSASLLILLWNYSKCVRSLSLVVRSRRLFFVNVQRDCCLWCFTALRSCLSVSHAKHLLPQPFISNLHHHVSPFIGPDIRLDLDKRHIHSKFFSWH